MKDPIYDEIVIVGIKLKNKIEWYISNKFIWIMDLTQLSKDALIDYFKDKDLKSIRENIITLSEETVETFLMNIKQYKANINELRLKIINRRLDNKNNSGLEDFFPVLFIDFDKKTLYSQYPEPFAFENYIPHNWIGTYKSFTELISNSDKYWIYNNENLFF